MEFISNHKNLLPRQFLGFILLLSGLGVFSQTMVSPEIATYLPDEISETSGLVNLNGEIWTHNDSGGEAELYQIDTETGEIIRTVEISNADNNDWEDIAHDESYVYIGDFGNNYGDRTDLAIYRVEIADIADDDEVDAEMITFHYDDQSSFEPDYHNTNFDCEALICYEEHLYLFTKNWIDLKTNCYKLPKTIGDHEAVFYSNFNPGFLVTGSDVMPGMNQLILIGYNSNGGSFGWIFTDFDDDDFFSGANEKLIMTIISQIEGVCPDNEESVFISSEEFSGVLDPTLYHLDISEFLTGILPSYQPSVELYYANGYIVVQSNSSALQAGSLQVYDLTGKELLSKELQAAEKQLIQVSEYGGVVLVVWQSGTAYKSACIHIP